MHALSDIRAGQTHNGIPESLERSHLTREDPAVLHRAPDGTRTTGTAPASDLAAEVDRNRNVAAQETRSGGGYLT